MVVKDSLDKTGSINGHGITIEWLLNSLKEKDPIFQKLHGHRKFKDVTAFDISSGKGFISEILRCTLTFADSTNPSDVYTTILKIPGLESLIETSSKSGADIGALVNQNESEYGVKDMHKNECEFYNNFGPALDAPILKVFKTQLCTKDQKGCIHMEDLTGKGISLSIYDSANLNQVKAYIQALAHMNKNSLAKNIKLDQGNVLNIQKHRSKMVNFFKPMVDKMIGQCKQQDYFKSIFNKYRKVYENFDFFVYANSQAYKDHNIEPVIIHGDMHAGNIMWAIDENGDIQNHIEAIIDWQTIFEGSPMFELARFLVMCASGVVRRQSEDFAIEYYLKCLIKEFNGDESKVPYTAEQLKMSYNYGFLTQIIMIVGDGIFFAEHLNDKNLNQAIKDAFLDEIELKTIMACEDGAKLLEGEMKHVFDQYSN